MNHAIAQLDIAAQIAEHNAPISEAQGDAAQAELQNQVAADCARRSTSWNNWSRRCELLHAGRPDRAVQRAKKSAR
ncbi:hypothetical protein [Pseudomonas aeruginosa]|uniref:hypothetical protein n=1 Tax=Pseudomonas aeruginosa TaxID=287 RepID=UPI0013C4BF77|nr:hypothetical protein [Pseudomonas aeruginosa]